MHINAVFSNRDRIELSNEKIITILGGKLLQILDIKTMKSLALQDIVQKVHQSVMDFKLEPKVKIFILSKLGQLE